MNHPRSYLFIVALCLTDIALVDAVPDPVVVLPPPALVAQVLPKKPVSPPPPADEKTTLRRKPQDHGVLFNVGLITAIAALLAALAQLIGSLRKR
jgi:hypothetical protein